MSPIQHTDTAQQPRIAKISTTARWKPEISFSDVVLMCGVATCETTSLYLSKWEFRGILSYDKGVCIDHVPPRDRGKPRKPVGIGSTAYVWTRWLRVHYDLTKSEGPSQVWFFASLNWVYTMESCWNPNSKTRETDRPQHYRPTVCVIAKQYSSATFVSLRFHFRWGKIRHVVRKRHQLISLSF